MNTPHISTSIRALLLELAASQPCCRLVLRAIERLESGRRSRVLNPAPCGDYWTYRESQGLVTYCPSNRQQVINDDGTWARAGRQGMKPAKFLRELLHPRLAKRIRDQVFADFATKFKASENENSLSFEFVDFSEAYDKKNYGSDHGIVSCMWGGSVGEFYSHYPVKVLVCADGAGKFKGRALVWEKVEGMGAPLMDRVYAASPEIEELFFRHAAENGWYRKARQNNSCFSEYVRPNGEPETFSPDTLRVLPVQGKAPSVDFWPYLDTFRAMNEDGAIFNSADENGAIAILDCTDGTRSEVENHEGQTLCEDGEWYDDDECVMVGGNWYHQDSDEIVTCEHSGENILRADAYRVEIGNRIIYLHEDHVERA